MMLAMTLEPVAAPRRSAFHRTRHRVRVAADHPWVENFSRFGYFIRGLINLLPGVLALQFAFGHHGLPMTRNGAIEMIGHQPLGRVYLVIVAIGLLCYSMWGVVRAAFDPLNKGRSASGLMSRSGYVTSALAHAGLFAATVRYLAGAGAERPHDWTADLLAHPLGPWLVGIIGLCWIVGAGILPILDGGRGTFVERDLDLSRVKSAERRWARELGRIGMTGRGFVGLIMGLLLVFAAFHLDVRHESGMDGALLELARQTYGRVLLASAALGLIAYGAYSMMCARWMRMRHPDRVRHAHPHGSRSRRSSHG